jgi:hypothetical protein
MPRAVSVRQPATKAAMPQPGPKIRPTTRATAMTPASTNQKTGRGWICTTRRYAPAGRPQYGNRWGLRQHKRRGAWELPRTLAPRALASFMQPEPQHRGAPAAAEGDHRPGVRRHVRVSRVGVSPPTRNKLDPRMPVIVRGIRPVSNLFRTGSPSRSCRLGAGWALRTIRTPHFHDHEGGSACFRPVQAGFPSRS